MLTDIDSVACEVLQQYPIKRAAFFGSAARGDMKENSDIDMIVEFMPDTRGIEFFGLLVDLQEALGCHVDLLTYNALETEAKPRFRENVMRDVRVIYERAS
jgi:predicted nucleotidyltransferase